MRRFASLLVLLLLLAGCAPKGLSPHLREDVQAFATQLPPLPEEAQSRLYADLLAHRYEPWREEACTFDPDRATWALRFFEKRTLYGENLRPIPRARYDKWVKNARYTALGSLCRPALCTHPTSMRLLPTDRPIFFDPDKPGEGYPFDYNQNSALKALTPLRVSHLSEDGGWAFVRSSFAEGWVPVRDIAYIDGATVATLEAAPLAVLLADEAPVYDEAGRFAFYAKSATLFPLAGERGAFWRIRLPEGSTLKKGWLPKAWSTPMPLPMTPENVACIAGGLLNEPYGWGGLAGDRDCSATVRDFFAPFGVWLPRNSAAQARIGRVISLRGLSPRKKERLIVEKGVPFRTLLYMKGHIMLYVGQLKGRAYALHNLWGIRTEEGGRIVVGRTVVSDLWLGANIPRADESALPIHRLESMNILF
ncbi:SH3 domain-containing protein [Hydrogenimonas sp.]